MKAYVRDFDGEKFINIEIDISNEYDFTNHPKTALIEPYQSHNCDKELADQYVAQLNSEMVSELTMESDDSAFVVKKCKDCGGYFIINKKTYVWFIERGLSIPARCDSCRQLRKDRRKLI